MKTDFSISPLTRAAVILTVGLLGLAALPAAHAQAPPDAIQRPSRERTGEKPAPVTEETPGFLVKPAVKAPKTKPQLTEEEWLSRLKDLQAVRPDGVPEVPPESIATPSAQPAAPGLAAPSSISSQLLWNVIKAQTEELKKLQTAVAELQRQMAELTKAQKAEPGPKTPPEPNK